MLESVRGCIKRKITVSKSPRCEEGMTNSMDWPKYPQWKLETTNGKFHWVGRIPSHSVRYFSL